MDCGVAALRMVAKHYNKEIVPEKIRQVVGYNKEGVNLLGLSEAAEKLGFRTRAVQITFEQLIEDAFLPAILHWKQNHFVVILKNSTKNKLVIADPAVGILSLTKDDFLQNWISLKAEEHYGTVLLLEPTREFHEDDSVETNSKMASVVMRYLKPNSGYILQVFFAFLLTSLFQIILPFLSKSIVDTGINYKNLSFITVLLIAQLVLIFSRAMIDFLKAKLLLFVSIRINASLLSDFWIKLTKLPISYFGTYHVGDTLQRIQDSKTIENFLTNTTLNTVFSLFNFFIFGAMLWIFSKEIVLIFSIFSIAYFLWIYVFLRIRRKINYKTFELASRENSTSLQLIQGMSEIKLNSAERVKRWEWENIQAAVFKLSFKNLSYTQLQQAGGILINEGKNVVITFISAGLVIKGDISLGTMLAIQYILGQLNSPIEQIIQFFQKGQDAKISLERINEVHNLENEEREGVDYLNNLPINKSISIDNLTYTYPGAGNSPVLSNICLTIPQGCTTAIVGVSGSGKTTLLKILLKFFDSYEGRIKIGDTDFKAIGHGFWRKNCGTVMQDGYIFSDTIANNITIGCEDVNYERLNHACKVANILEFIESLPNGYNSKIGADGIGLSQGQKQRLLIARAAYKNPEYLFLDEATNSLDANNEKQIVENLNKFLQNKTVMIIAHRLSTVKNADKIVVLENGKIVEEGTHQELTQLQGKYFELVKNQLELGN